MTYDYDLEATREYVDGLIAERDEALNRAGKDLRARTSGLLMRAANAQCYLANVTEPLLTEAERLSDELAQAKAVARSTEKPLHTVGRKVHAQAARLWPWETEQGFGLALTEELGEVVRALVKRNHAAQSGALVKGLTEEEWTKNLREELAQLVSIAARIAYIEGFPLEDDLLAVVAKLEARKPGE